MDIFNILQQDADDVILIINYFLDCEEYGTNDGAAPAPAQTTRKHGIDEFWSYV